MNKAEVYAFLEENGIVFEITEHKAVFNMEEAYEIELLYPDREAKNLFVRDDKKRNYYLISVKGDKRVDLKEFRRRRNLRALSFASEEDLRAVLGLEAGSVTPLGILNDAENKVRFYLDSEFDGGIIGVHLNENTATVWLPAADLMKIIREHGNEAEFVEIT